MVTKDNRAVLDGWAERLEALGLEGVASALLQVARPLGPIGAGALWMAQPALGLFFGTGGREGVAWWAHLLEDPDAMDALETRLAGEELDDRER
jgi:hypothetical protein